MEWDEFEDYCWKHFMIAVNQRLHALTQWTWFHAYLEAAAWKASL
jgi:hypothetical protein